MQNTEKPKTQIAEDVEIVGSIKSTGDVHLAGKLNGDLSCQGQAVIGESAVIKGNISADSTSISGQVNGNIAVKDRIELKATARLNGDIRARRLTVEDGVTFVGKSEVNPSGASQRAASQPKDAQESAADAEAPHEPAAVAEGRTEESAAKGKGAGFGRK